MTQATAPPYTAAPPTLRSVVEDMRGLSVRALQRMYLPEQGLFAFRIARRTDGVRLEGASLRYTAIVLIGLAGEDDSASARVFGSEMAGDVCGRLIAQAAKSDNLGDVALTLWAAKALEHDAAPAALERLRQLRPVRGRHPTVELAWALAALSGGPATLCDKDLAASIYVRLMSCYHSRAGMFSHWPPDIGASWIRRHVCCFADLVYPIQALARYFVAEGERGGLEAARHCARRIGDAQGEHGQWWWHYDWRTGRVVEGYPVYSVHQDAMAPMALYALQEACGDDHSRAIERGVRWLLDPPEARRTMIDTEADLIWRKVARHEPRKLARGVQALASRVHPSLRVPGLDATLRPGCIDFECRPYHLGWLLHAFPPERVARL